MAMERNYFLREVLPFTALLSVECTNVGMNTLYKAAVAKGLDFLVYMAYSYSISAAVLLPLAFLFHRKTSLPPFSIILIAKFFVLGFLGFAGQYLGNLGIKYSNPTMGSAMSNINPACTFFLAVILRMEKLNLKSMSGLAKVMGGLVSISGALVVVLYDGPLLIRGHGDTLGTISGPRSDWVMGGALNAACYLVSSIWYIYQTKVVREYPAELVLVFFYNFFAAILSILVGIASEPHLITWKISADVRLLSILYSGIIGTGYGIMIHIWGLHVKGPVYVSLFKPLSIAIAAILGVTFLGDHLYLGTVIGSAVITMGFYSVVWGKHKEERSDPCDEEETSTSDDVDVVVPLLRHHINPQGA